MPDYSLSQAIAAVNTAVRQHGPEATRILFDHYRTSRGEAQDAFVLALIGEVVAGHAMRAAPQVRDPQTVLDQVEAAQAEWEHLGLRSPRCAT